jgi:hypothetical protein
MVKHEYGTELAYFVWYHKHPTLQCHSCYERVFIEGSNVVTSCWVCGGFSGNDPDRVCGYEYGVRIEITGTSTTVVKTACSEEHLSLLMSDTIKPRRGYCPTCDIHYKGVKIFERKYRFNYSKLVPIGVVILGAIVFHAIFFSKLKY